MKLLFICTHNRCRSILAEAITNHYGEGLLQAKSAGSQPSGEVHPLSIRYLSEANIPTSYLRSKSWNEHENWNPDIVITVCDSAAGESCPIWFGNTIKVHWGLSDPSQIVGTEDDIAKAFQRTIATLKNRIQKLQNANTKPLSKKELISLLNKLGEN